MKKRLLTILTALFLSFGVQAQYNMDFGINFGASNYMGEIGGMQFEANPFLVDMIVPQTGMAFGGFYRYSFTDRLAAKVQLNWVRIHGADSLSDVNEAPQRFARNLSFRTDIFELMITGEYNWLVINDISRRSRKRIDFASYAFAGFGALLYYPHAKLDDKWYYLRPLATEGVDNEYNEMTIAVPLGVGAHFTIDNKYRIGMEIGYRFSFTDYLDDVSTRYPSPTDLPYAESLALSSRSREVYATGQYDNLPDEGFYRINESNNSIRGNPETNDGYLLVQFNVSYVIDMGGAFHRSRYKSLINRKRARSKF